jgi:hypothetical protein
MVSGSQRVPSRVRNQPLKSMPHRSFGASTGANGRTTGKAPRRRRRGALSPSRRSSSPMLDGAGQLTSGRRSTSTARSFFGPQLGRSRRSSITAPAIASAIARPECTGARERGRKPSSPPA